MLLFALLLSSVEPGTLQAFAQTGPFKKADSYFNNKEFSKAIPLYKKASDKNDEALKKLADCYRILKNYKLAEPCYEKLVSKKPSDPLIYFYYGESLLNNNKYDAAKKQFTTYSILDPDDKKGELYRKICDEIKELADKPALYRAYNLGEINSPVADFCPVLYKNGIVFSSERIKDLVMSSQSGTTGNPYLNLVFAKEEKRSHGRKDTLSKTNGNDSAIYVDARLFIEKLNGDGHYGPACFNADFTEMYFMKVSSTPSKRGAVSQSKIYCSKYKNGWGTPTLLSISSDEYSVGHPAISKDGQYLYFTSNMPGGLGGTDLWMSKREGETWGAAQNLGKEINTSGNEAYPSIGSDNMLYFSSTGHTGFGGLDIFAAVQKNGQWGGVSNMMPPINSTANDFGIVFKNSASGYFSSNREGGKGSDDLYGFTVSGKITSVSGKVLLSQNVSDGAPHVKVFLLSGKGTLLRTGSTDASGLFKFDNLSSDETYMVKIDENDPVFMNQKKLYLTDSKNKIVRVIGKNKEGFFIFENLPADLSKLSILSEDDVSIVGNLFAGDERAPLKNTKVNLLNSKGEKVQSTTTNSLGSFAFMNLPPNEDFTVSIEGMDPKFASKKIYFTNRNGKEIAICDGRSCEFRILASDINTLTLLKVEDSQLLADLNGILFTDRKGKTRLSKYTITVVDKDDNVLGTCQTDASGNFKFVNLPAHKSYMIRLKEDDPTLVAKDVFLANANGVIVATLKLAKKFFHYSFLAVDEVTLARIYYDDPWLSVSNVEKEATIIENIYFEYEKATLLSQAIITLNKVVGVMQENPAIAVDIIAHTDSRGTDEFNMKLSEKRAQSAVEYIISNGISRNRLRAIGMGETHLINGCKDGIECSEEQHAQNRRTEFKVKRSLK